MPMVLAFRIFSTVYFSWPLEVYILKLLTSLKLAKHSCLWCSNIQCIGNEGENQYVHKRKIPPISLPVGLCELKPSLEATWALFHILFCSLCCGTLRSLHSYFHLNMSFCNSWFKTCAGWMFWYWTLTPTL